MSLPHLDVHGLTHKGTVREIQEDQFLIAHLKRSLSVASTSLVSIDDTRLLSGTQGSLFLVADGFGGHRAGKEAIRNAVDTVVECALDTMPWFLRLDTAHEEDLRDELRSSLETGQARVLHPSRRNPAREGMGTTLAPGYLLWPVSESEEVRPNGTSEDPDARLAKAGTLEDR